LNIKYRGNLNADLNQSVNATQIVRVYFDIDLKPAETSSQGVTIIRVHAGNVAQECIPI